MDTKVIAEAMCRKYETRNPFDLAASLGIIVLHEPLGEILGYYNRCYKQKFIHINEELEGISLHSPVPMRWLMLFCIRI